MIFDSNGQPVPANGTAPVIAAIPLYVGAPFYVDESIGSLEFANGIYAAVSSTQETLTLSAQTIDITVEMDVVEEPAGTTFAGDTTTAVDSLVVYADGLPNTNLFAITAQNNNAGTLYLQLFTSSSPAAGAKPLFEYTFTTGQIRVLKFGKQGIHPRSGTAGNTPSTSTQTQGVYLYGSSTQNSYTASTGGQWNLQAEYGSVSKG